MLAHLRSLKNSPTSARDLSQILSPIRLGFWFTFFNGAVASAFALVYVIITELGEYSGNSFEQDIFTSVELGQLFASILFITVAIFLTIFVPIRIFGFLIGPRSLRYLDQIVISGISPTRYMAGKVILQNFFLLVVLAASIPYLALCFALGGVSIPFVLSSICALFLYTNLLCLVSLAASVFAFEFVAIPCVILFFGFAIWLGFLPFPPNLVSLTPIPIFTAPAYESLAAGTSALNASWTGILTSTILFGGLLGTHLFYYAITVAIAAAILFLFLSIGPLNSIVGNGPLSNFGTVIMPGDSKKRRLFRGHVLLRRRGELAFFYENRPARLRSLDIRLRWGIKEAIFISALAPAIFYLHVLVPAMSILDFYASTLFLGVFFFVVNAFVFNRDRATVNLHYPKRSAAEADTFFFFANSLLIFLFLFLYPYVRETELTPAPFRTYGGPQYLSRYEFLHGNFVWIGLVVTAWFAAFYALLQWLTTRIWSHFRAFVAALFLSGLSLSVPLLIHAALDNSFRGASASIKRIIDHIATFSPITPIGDLLGESAVRLPFAPSIWPSALAHLGIAALFFFLAYRRRKNSPVTLPS